MVASADDVLALVPMIYDAAVDPTRWQPFLETLNRRLDGASSVLVFQRIAGPQSGLVMAAVGVDDKDQERYEGYYSARNIWTIRGRDRLCQGAVLTGEDVCPNRDLERSEYYNDYLKGLGFYYALASVPSADAHTSLIVTTFRTRRRGPFEPDVLALQKSLTPHLQRAAQLYDRLASAEFRARAFHDALDRMPLGVVLLDPRRCPVFVNRAARAFMAAKDGLGLSPQGLTGASPAETAQLRRLVLSANTPSSVGSTGGGHVRLQRPSGRKPYEVMVAPLDVDAEAGRQTTVGVIVFIADPEEERPADPALLRQFYGLTPSEARLTGALLEGSTLADAADRLEVTRHTARWTLKQVLEKTDTRTQGQLIATALKGLSRLKPG